MKKLMYLIMIVLTVIITGCNTDSKMVDALVVEAEQYEEQNDYTNAIAKYEEVIELSEDSQYQTKVEELSQKKLDSIVEEAAQYEEQNDYTNAIAKYEEVIELSSDSEYQSKVEELELKQETLEKDIGIVNKTIEEMESVLYNPESLQIHEVIIYRRDGWSSVYMDYSAMNKMGGYNRDYAYSSFNDEELDSFFGSFESNYRSAEKDLETEDETYYFDLANIEEKYLAN